MIKKSMVVLLLSIIVLFNLAGPITPAAGKAPQITISYFVDDTGSGTSCTQASPCSLATAIGKADAEMNIYLAAGTYFGTGDEVVLITSDNVINLYGGWNGTTVNPPVRNPDTYVSIIDGQGLRRGIKIVFSHSPALSPVITGLTITGGNGSIVPTDCKLSSSEDGCGGGIYSYYASPNIYSNKIHGNYGSTLITAGKQGGGGGIYAYASKGALIHDNLIYGNIADPNRQGIGGGVELIYSDTVSEFYNNEVYGNTAGHSTIFYWGSGVALRGDNGHIYSNFIHDNGELVGVNGLGSGIYLWYGAPDIEDNLITGNYGSEAVYLGYAADAYFHRNHVVANASTRGMTLTPTVGSVVVCDSGDFVTVHNNFFSGTNDLGIYVMGSDVATTCAGLWHNSIDGDNRGIYFTGTAMIDMVNNIISNHSTIGIEVAGGATPLIHHTLFYNNGTDGYTGANSINGDPVYKNRAFGNLHVWCTSPARDTGDATIGYFDDIDGQQRPVYSGVDIGADECTPLFYLPFLNRN